jgi:hypothetical protein
MLLDTANSDARSASPWEFSMVFSGTAELDHI